MLTPILAHAHAELTGGVILDEHDDLLLIIRHADRGVLALPLLTANLVLMTDPLTTTADDPADDEAPANWQVLRPGSFMFGITSAVAISRASDKDETAREAVHLDLIARYKAAFPDSDLSDDSLIRDDVLFLATAATLGGTLRPEDGWDGIKRRYGKLHDREPDRNTTTAVREYVRHYLAAAEAAGVSKDECVARFNEEVNEVGTRIMAFGRKARPAQPGGPQQ